MPFETALNVFWAGVALCALGASAWANLRRRAGNGCTGVARLLAVLLAVLFLFPCVSESDDRMTMLSMQFALDTRGEVGQAGPRDPGGEDAGLRLGHFFESLQNFEIAAFCLFDPTLLAVALVTQPAAKDCARRLAAVPGRAPPYAC